MNEIMSAADHAAQQSDRWMFVFLLLVMIAGFVVLWRWMASANDRLAKRHDSLTDSYITTVKELASVVANNTAALNEFRKTAERCTLDRRT